VLSVPPGYVRSGPTHAGRYLYWESSCVFVTIDAAGTAAVPPAAALSIIAASLATWNDAGGPSCSYLKIMTEARRPLEVGTDGVNLIKFRDTTWGRPAVHGDPARLYPLSAAGLTTLVFVDDGGVRDGAIIDADIEINGVNFAIAIGGITNSPLGCKAELQNTLTHELGHLLGLEHTCLAPGDPARIDHQGNPVPACDMTTDPRILDATMYNFQTCGETTKESLSDDDIQGKCDIYPLGRDPGSCGRVGPDGLIDTPNPTDDVFGVDRTVVPTGGGCCGAAGSTRPEASILLTGLTIALVIRRRRS